MMRKDHPDIAGMGFEQGMAELEALVKRLEGCEVDLEESLADFERGHALQAHLSEKLRVIELRIETITAAQGVVPEPGEAREETGSSDDVETFQYLHEEGEARDGTGSSDDDGVPF